jgi:hypothetical protein
MSWAAFITAGIGGWVKKGAASLGLGLVSYVGFQAIKSQLDSAMTGMWTGMGADVYSVVALAGFVDAVGIWLGALTTAVSLLSFQRLGVLQA